MIKVLYYLTGRDGTEVEVSKEEYVAAERAAGFYNKGRQDEAATHSFSGLTSVSGRIDYVRVP